MFEQAQWQRSLKVTNESLGGIPPALKINLKNQDYELYLFNLLDGFKCCLFKAMLSWGVGKDPRPALEEGYQFIDHAIATFEKHDKIIVGWSYMYLIYAAMMGTITGRDVELWPHEPHKSEFNAVALELGLLARLRGEPSKGSVEALSGKLYTQSRYKLLIATHETYEALLDSVDTDVDVDTLVAQAAKNYERRARNAYFSGSIFGGGFDNPYVIDFGLAAVLKKINWQGDSIHKWVWD